MKSNSILLQKMIVFSFVLCMNCKKNNVKNPPVTGTQPRCLISTKTIFSPNAPGYVEEDSIEYNTLGQFSGYHRGGVKDGVASYNDHYEIRYTAQGQIDSIIFFEVNELSGIYKVFYNNNFVSAVIQVTGKPDTANFSWNTHNQKELDAVIYSASLGCITSPETLYFNYQVASASSSDVQGETATSCAVKGRVDDVYTVFSTNPQSTEIRNPFRDSTTHEQQFLYYYFRVMDPVIVLSKNWPLAVFEGYSYASGQKMPLSHFYFNYVTDNNHLVTSAAVYTASDYPGFSYFTLLDSTKFSYTCK